MDRSALVDVLEDHREEYDSDCGMYYGCLCGWDNGTKEHNNGFTEHLADAILASA
jgi:hypothetical protein